MESNKMTVPIEISARHIHLTEEDFHQLFGEKAELARLKNLSQPKNFAAKQTVAIKTSAGKFAAVRIVGSFRKYTQIEISKTDAYNLDIDPPVRDSHELEHAGTPGVTVVGPEGKVELEKGVIIPWRHIHMHPSDAAEAGVEDGDLVMVDIDNDPRSVIFENVLIRISPAYRLAMQIDTDEANAAGISGGEVGTLLKQE